MFGSQLSTRGVTLSLLAASFSFHSNAFAAAAVGRPAAVRHINPSGGYSVEVPAGWHIQETGTAVLGLAPPEGAGEEIYMVVGLEIHSASQDEAALQIQQAFVPEGAAMTAVYESARDGATAIHDWQFQHPETGGPVRFRAFLVEQNGRVLGVLGVGDPEIVIQRDATLRSIAASLLTVQPGVEGSAPDPVDPAAASATRSPKTPERTTTVQSPASADSIQRDPAAPATPGRLADNDPQSAEWLNHLGGKLLTRLESYSSGSAGGYSSTERMALYPNGQFEHYSSSSVSVQVGGPEYGASGSAGGQGQQRGAWRIVTVRGTSYLALIFEGSNQEKYAQLVYQDGKTYLDGSRVFVTAQR